MISTRAILRSFSVVRGGPTFERSRTFGAGALDEDGSAGREQGRELSIGNARQVGGQLGDHLKRSWGPKRNASGGPRVTKKAGALAGSYSPTTVKCTVRSRGRIASKSTK